jgi:hypothetical protein
MCPTNAPTQKATDQLNTKPMNEPKQKATDMASTSMNDTEKYSNEKCATETVESKDSKFAAQEKLEESDEASGDACVDGEKYRTKSPGPP